MLQIAWIAGWGVHPEMLRALAGPFAPEGDHTFHFPRPHTAFEVQNKDLIIAWSLGALRMLEAAAAGARFGGRVILLAPFVAFCSEHGRGGKCSLTQVRFLKRWVRRQPDAAVADFYSRAGLGALSQAVAVPVPDLLEGLDRLAADASPALRAFAANELPPDWQAWVGDSDPLLDASGVAASIRGCHIAARADHSIRSLLSHAFQMSNSAHSAEQGD